MFFRSVKYKVLLTTLLTILSASFLFIYILFSYIVEDRLNYTKITTDLIVSHQAKVSMMPMWELDNYALETILDVLSETPYFVSATLYDENKLPVAALSKRTVTADMDIYRTRYPILHPYENSGVQLGLLEVSVNTGEMVQAISDKLHRIIGYFFLLVFILTAILYVLLHIFITKPIEDLSRAFRKISDDEDHIEIPELNRKDEIGDLVSSAHILNFRRLETLKKAQNEKHKAQNANKAKNSFLMRVSHELRTPLNGILGFLDILESHVDKNGAEYFKTISKLSRKMLYQVDELLDFSDIENNQIQMNYAPSNLAKLYKDVSDKFIDTHEINGNEIIFSSDPLLPKSLLFDQKRLEQVLVHLIKNAVKFTKDGCINIHISFLSVHMNTVHLRFSVKDNGVGIDRAFQEKALDVFSQEDESITRQYEGIGIGLSVTNSLLRLMHSKLQFESQKGEGTHFFFDLSLKREGTEQELVPYKNYTIPIYVWDVSKEWRQYIAAQIKSFGLTVNTFEDLKDVKRKIEVKGDYNNAIIIANPRYALDTVIPELEEIAQESKSKLVICQSNVFCVVNSYSMHLLHKPITSWSIYNILDLLRKETKDTLLRETQKEKEERIQKNKKILVVEDDLVNQRLAKTMLEKVGYRIDIAENGQEALIKHQEEDYAFILMDIMMPIMDGFEATKEIRKMKNEKGRVPIIAVTANAYRADQDACFNAGMNGYVSKPYNLEKLLHEVECVFSKHQ